MEYQRQETMAWNARLAAISDHASRMRKSMAAGTVPVMKPPPPPAGEQPILLTFEDFVAQHCPTPGTNRSYVGGGANYGSTPESRSPVTPIHHGGGGHGLAGSTVGSNDDLGFGGLGGTELGGDA